MSRREPQLVCHPERSEVTAPSLNEARRNATTAIERLD
jgi:hypothetical protein